MPFPSGPGAYNVPGMGADSMRKAYIESTRRGVFGTTAVRINPMTKKDERENPGPSHYQIREKPYETRYTQPTSNFASLTNRLQEAPPIVRVSVETCVARFTYHLIYIMAVKWCVKMLMLKCGESREHPTAVRINLMTKKEERENPGPSHYQVREKPYETRYTQPTSNFASLTNRL